MHRTITSLRMPHLVLLLALVLLVTSCGSESTNSGPTEPPTAAPTTGALPTPTEDSEEGGGVVRTIRGAPGAVWDGISWVWDRGSDGVNTVWDGIRSAGGFLWGNVTGLSTTVWGWMTSFWRWVASSEAGDAARATVELLKKLNPGSLIDGLMDFLRNLLFAILKIVGVVALIVLLVFGFLRFGLWKQLIRLFWGSAEKGLSKISTPGTTARKQSLSETTEVGSPTDDDRKFGSFASSHPRSEGFRVELAASEGWTQSQIHELRDLVTNQTVIVLFGRAMKHNGGPVNDVELMRVTGRSRAQIRADFSAFARLCRTVHPRGSLPIETTEATTDGSAVAYRVPGQYLEWWFED